MGRPVNLHKFGSVRDVEAKTIVKVQAYINGSVQNGYLYQQKNNNTFLVTTTVNPTLPLTAATSAVCKFVNSASPTAGQMSVQATTNATSHFYVSRITNRYVYDFSTPVVKFHWAYTLVPDAPLHDYPQILNVSLPSASKPATPNLAP